MRHKKQHDRASLWRQRPPSRGAAGRLGATLLSLCLALAGATTLAGCSAFDEHRQSLARMHADGRYDLADEALHEPEIRRLYGDRNELLLLLDQGAVALALGRYEEAVDLFTDAESLMDRRRSASAGEQVGALLLGDAQSPYLGEPYEEMDLNVLKLVAQLASGRIQGGATVEARRMAIKANVLRDRYIKLRDSALASPDLPLEDPSDAGSFSGLTQVNEQGRFIESTLGDYLSAVAFMQSGDAQDQAVASRRLIEAIHLQQSLIGPVDPAPFEDLESLAPDEVNGLVVAFSGRGPLKTTLPIGPIYIEYTPIFFKLPILHWSPSEAAEARVVLRSLTPGADDEVDAALHLVEDLSSVANVNHQRQLPLIYLRTLLRAAAKSIALRAASRAIERSSDSGAALAGVAVGSLAALIATERADVRSWVFLPGQAHVGLLKLTPGDYDVRIEYVGASGQLLYASPWRRRTFSDGRFTTIVEHFWR